MTLIFSSTYSPIAKDDFSYPSYGVIMSRKFSKAIWISKTPSKTHSCLNFFQHNLPSERLWEGMESKKWPLAHVWSHIIALMYPKVTPFVSACRYDHEEVLERTFDVTNSHKKFLHGPQGRRWWSLKHNFRPPQIDFYCKLL